MIDYITKIIIPFTEKKRRELHLPYDQAALAIFDEFKGQVTEKCTELLLENNILIVRVPPNCTDRLQPLDISVNKAAKDFLKRKFQEWYSEQIFRQLDQEIEPDRLEPVDLRMSLMKPLGAQWIISLCDYLSSHPDIIVNGFKQAGISGILEQ